MKLQNNQTTVPNIGGGQILLTCKILSRFTACVLTLALMFALVPAFTLTVGAATYAPNDWATVQSIVDNMDDGDILDLSSLPKDMPLEFIINVYKDITVIESGVTFNDEYFNPGVEWGKHFDKLSFVLSGGATITFKNVTIRPAPIDSVKSIVSGTGNVVVEDSRFVYERFNKLGENIPAAIDVLGDVDIKGDPYITSDGGTNYWSTEIVAAAVSGGEAGAAISAVNITIDGGRIVGGNARLENIPPARGMKGGDAIIASGNVEVNGTLVYMQTWDGYWSTTEIVGGEGDVGVGGAGIKADGDITMFGGWVQGGDAIGNRSDSNDRQTGGSGIVAGGNVRLEGELISGWASCQVRSGHGIYENGVPFMFTGNDDTPARILIANNAQVSDVNRWENATARVAPYAVGLKANDIAIFNGGRIGWYTDMPLFANGYYHLSSMAAQWGTLTNGVTEFVMPVPTINGTPTIDSITLNEINFAEYSKDNGTTWQDSPTFTGLAPNTEYTFIARIKYTSVVSTSSVSIKTDNDPSNQSPSSPYSPSHTPSYSSPLDANQDTGNQTGAAQPGTVQADRWASIPGNIIIRVSFTQSNGTIILDLNAEKTAELISTAIDGVAILDLSGVQDFETAVLDIEAAHLFSEAGISVRVIMPGAVITIPPEVLAKLADNGVAQITLR